MFSWFWSSTSNEKNILSLKEEALSETIATRPRLLQNACIELKRLFPTCSSLVFDEKQQLFNPWLNVFYDVLLLIIYLPKALKICEEILTTMETLALTATKTTCTLSQLKTLEEKLMNYLENYDRLCWIDLSLYGRKWLSNGTLTINVGRENAQYPIQFQAFDSISLSLQNLDFSNQDNIAFALKKIQEARKTVNYNVILYTHHYQQDLEMLISQIFIRITPIFSQITLLEKIAEDAIKSTTTPGANEKFQNALKELDSLLIIHSKYGKQQLGQGEFSIELGDFLNVIRINLPTIDFTTHDMNLLTIDNAQDALTLIKKMKQTFMQSPYYIDISLKNALADEDSDEAGYNLLLSRYS